MHWDHLFDELEGQLASEWEAERAALDAEAERLRIARIPLLDRLRALRGAQLRLDCGGGEVLSVALREVGADWLAAESLSDRRMAIVPIAALASLGAEHGPLLHSLEPIAPAGQVRSRVTLGFLLRDLARRRVPVRLATDGEALHGTIDRAGADHLDLAVHDADEPRRASAVRGFRIVPFASMRWLSIDPRAFAAVG